MNNFSPQSRQYIDVSLALPDPIFTFFFVVAETEKSGLAKRDYIDVAKLIRWWQRILSSPTRRVPAQLPIIIIYRS